MRYTRLKMYRCTVHTSVSCKGGYKALQEYWRRCTAILYIGIFLFTRKGGPYIFTSKAHPISDCLSAMRYEMKRVAQASMQRFSGAHQTQMEETVLTLTRAPTLCCYQISTSWCSLFNSFMCVSSTGVQGRSRKLVTIFECFGLQATFCVGLITHGRQQCFFFWMKYHQLLMCSRKS
jgi:hypothetical protein